MSTILSLLVSAVLEHTVCRVSHSWRYHQVKHPSGLYAFRTCRLCKDFESVAPR